MSFGERVGTPILEILPCSVRVLACYCNELNFVVSFAHSFLRSQSHSERLKTFFKTQKLRDIMSFQVICHVSFPFPHPSSLLSGLVELPISFQRLFNAVAQQISTFSKARKPSYVTLRQDLYVGLAPHTAPAIFSLLQVKLSLSAGLCSCGCR
jgi:hypothetical protein